MGGSCDDGHGGGGECRVRAKGRARARVRARVRVLVISDRLFTCRVKILMSMVRSVTIRT